MEESHIQSFHVRLSLNFIVGGATALRAGVLSIVAAAALLVSACGESSTGASSGNASASSASSSPAAGDAGSHNYALKDGEAYGYTSAVSQDDKASGQAAGEVNFLRYAGEKGNVYYLVDGKKDGTEYYSCEKPCKYMKEALISGDEEKTMEATPGTMGAVAFEDAQSGKLTVSPSAVTELAPKVDLSTAAKP